MMQYLKPSLQTYAWGSHSYIQELLQLKAQGPLAEAWYGAHPKAPSAVEDQSLIELISADPSFWLGPDLHSLPFLLKILAAEQALSIQVHPSKSQAEEGFARENELGIPLNDPTRNYRDDNHKPELIMSLTEFHALTGLRDFHQIAKSFDYCKVGSFFAHFRSFCDHPSLDSFTRLYQEILCREPLPNLSKHIAKLDPQGKWAQEIAWMQELIKLYPSDRSVISPLFMNLIQLKPFEAIFIDAGMVHAYLKGAGIEIMACSDNVLRAGLSPKHIDVPELMKTVNIQAQTPQIIQPRVIKNQLTAYPAVAKDFALYRIKVEGEMPLPDLPGPRILLCLSGAAKLSRPRQELDLIRSQSIIIPHAEQMLSLAGKAEIILAAIQIDSPLS